MTFVCMLLALLVDRVLTDFRPQRRHRWFASYCDRLAGTPWLRWSLDRPWGVLLLLLPPLLAIAWLQSLAAAIGAPVYLAFATLVLVYSLGPRELGEDVEAFTAARDRGDEPAAAAFAHWLSPGAVPTDEPRRSIAVARGVVFMANRRLLAPLLWFLLLGPVGAAAYRLVQLLAEYLAAGDCPAGMRQAIDRLCQAADWLPARVTAAGYAITGNFDAVAHAWRSFRHDPDAWPATEAEQFLARTGFAALDGFADDDGLDDAALDLSPVAAMPHLVEDALALAWRTLTVWVVLVGGGTLVAWIA
jgi:AmpE protein